MNIIIFYSYFTVNNLFSILCKSGFLCLFQSLLPAFNYCPLIITLRQKLRINP